MAINKVIFGENTLVDLTNDTVSPDKLLLGETAHDASGNSIEGEVTVPSGNYYGTCIGQSANQNKVATIPEEQGFSLKVGVIIFVRFDETNTYSATEAAPVTLNVNNTGAKQVYGNDTSTLTGKDTTHFGRANYINQYVYNGTYWVWTGTTGDNNTTYTPMTLGGGYGTCTTAASTVAKAATLSNYSLVKGGKPVIKFTKAVPANATLNINSKGAKPIFYKGDAITAGVINAGNTVTFIYDGTQYHVISVDTDGVTITQTLTAGSTSLTMSHSAITTSSTIDIYSSVWGVNPKTVTVSAGKIVMTFDAQLSNVDIKVVVK